ncbi:hypothetical protein NX059_000251 [Plenodomus lindquistii]|nr:hypothetical protein NX059_000251 [Plenodomus lindquistii]
MTTAHRPTFDPARGKEAQRGPAYHQRLLPAHTTLKHRQPGQGGDVDGYKRDLRAELLEAEARHFAKKNGTYVEPEAAAEPGSAPKRQIDQVQADSEGGDDDEADQKRRRIEILEKFREIDADDSSSGSDSSDDECVALAPSNYTTLLTITVTRMKKTRRQRSCASSRRSRRSVQRQRPKRRQSAQQRKTNSAKSMSRVAIHCSTRRTLL